MDVRKLLRLLPYYKFVHSNITFFYKQTLLDFIEKAKVNVPYYKNSLAYAESFEQFPILRKTDIIEQEDLFLSKKHFKMFLKKSSTGGTSGMSLNLYRSINDIVNEVAYVDYAFSLIGNNLKVAVMRGNNITGSIGKKKGETLLLSSYKLSDMTIKEYLRLIKKHNINCLHAYPTSIMIFLKLVDQVNMLSELNKIRGILTSSEVLSMSDKVFIKQKLPHVKLIDLYGQNEHVSFAISEDLMPYKFFNCYGYTEFVKIDSGVDNKIIAEIVSTGLSNSAMPLIRYGTEDFVEINEAGDVISIIGRSQDYLYDSKYNSVPCTILTRPNTLKNVLNFQFYQEKPGYVEFRVVVNNSFGDNDVKNILFDFSSTFNDRITAQIMVMDSLQRTKAGKIIRLIQNIKK